ncbi:MAG: polysaccharide deacetylase family protein [Sphingomonas sp.]|nr:polysaccharide deacetylase family protein [Sphingomonas sp.]
MRAVLTFHSIDDLPGPLSYSPAGFERMLDALNQARLPVVDLDTLLADPAAKGVSLTFDDGIKTVFDAAMPVLAERKLPAHVFVITDWVGGDNRWPGQPDHATPFGLMNWDQLEAIHKAGIRVEAHTASHPDLRSLSDPEIDVEMTKADEAIEARLGRRPRYFAYPYGYHDDRVRAVASRRYRGCFTTKLDYLHADSELDVLPRLDTHYLRSPSFVRNLGGRPAHAYIALRRALRRLRGY